MHNNQYHIQLYMQLEISCFKRMDWQIIAAEAQLGLPTYFVSVESCSFATKQVEEH
jgi:hypothetical protein